MDTREKLLAAIVSLSEQLGEERIGKIILESIVKGIKKYDNASIGAELFRATDADLLEYVTSQLNFLREKNIVGRL